MRKFINYYRGEVILDISSKAGENLHSDFYKKRTASGRVINDIRNNFQVREQKDSNLEESEEEKVKEIRQDVINGVPQVQPEQTEGKKEPTGQQLKVGSLIYTKTPVQAADFKEINKFFVIKQVNIDDGTFIAFALTSNLETHKYRDSFLLPADKINRFPKDSLVRTNREFSFPEDWKHTKLSGVITPEQMLEITKVQENYKKMNKIELVEVSELSKPEINETRDAVQKLYDSFKHDPEVIVDYLKFSAKFYQFSARNQALIYSQNEGATFVAGKHSFKEKGYEVSPDATPISILRPSRYNYFFRNGEAVPVQKALQEEKRKIQRKEIEVRSKMNFYPVHVYDISQTNCPVEEYPKLFHKGYESEHHKTLCNMVIALSENAGISVRVEDLSSISLNGYYQPDQKAIFLNSSLNDTERLTTMCHEFAHAVLEHTSKQSKEIIEFEAQALACVLLSTYNLEPSQNDLRYMVEYYDKAKENNKFQIEDTLKRIHNQVKFVNERVVWTPEIEQLHQQEISKQIDPSNNPLAATISDSQVFTMN